MVDDLRRRLPPPVLVPRAGGEFNLIRRAPDPDTLVLPGGGAKGVAYVGLLRVMKEDGAFASVHRLVGSSAGSLAATVMAFTDDDKGMQHMLASELPTLLDTQEDLRAVYPGLTFHNTMSAFARAIWRLTGGKPLGEANGLVRKLDEITGSAAKQYLDGLADDTPTQDRSAPGQSADTGLDARVGSYAAARGLDAGALMARLDALRRTPDFASDRTGKMVTFRDADLLHHLAPRRFRTVEMTAYAPETGEIRYFDAETTPDVPLAYATRASLSHPLLATGVRINTGPVLIDGGLRSNIPSEAVFGRDRARAAGEPANRLDEELRARTMVLQFDNSRSRDPATRAPKPNPKPKPKPNIVVRCFSAIASFFASLPRRFMNWFMRLVSLNPHFDADRAADRDKFAAAGSNGLLMRHGSLRTIDLDVSPARQEAAIDAAAAGLREQLADREDQAWFVAVNSARDAYAMLTQAEKARIQQAGPPIAAPVSGYDAAWADYDAAKAAFLRAEAQGVPLQMQRATADLERAEQRMYRAENDKRHVHARHRLAVELYRLVSAEPDGGSPVASVA